MIPEPYAKYAKTVTISVVNYRPVWGDKPANLEKIKRIASTAASAGTNIIAFPEMALSGYECTEEARRDHQPCTLHVSNAETIPGPATQDIAKLAKELGVYILFGMPEREPDDPRILYNAVAVTGPEGLLGKYRKLHLSPPPIWSDTFCFHPGNELPIFETAYGPIGVQICADFWAFPELSRILWLKGARIIFNCAASSSRPGREEVMTQCTGSRSTESVIFAASANMVGTEQTFNYYGHATIAGPQYPRYNHIYAQGGYEEEIVTAALNFEGLHQLWNTIDHKKMHRTELIAEEYRKLAEAKQQKSI